MTVRTDAELQPDHRVHRVRTPASIRNGGRNGDRL